MACFGKTQQAARERTNNRTLRRRGGLPARNSANHELPRDQWIEIPVPALIDPDTFALAAGAPGKRQEARFASNARTQHSPGPCALPPVRVCLVPDLDTQ